MRSLEDPAEFAAVAAEYGVACDHAVIEALFRYLDLLYLWNTSAGLTTIGRADAPVLHLLDSLVIGPLLGQPGTVADFGTGAGLPGVPLALLRPDLELTLVDSNRRKCSFLNDVARNLELANVTVVHTKIEALPRPSPRFGLVVSRAFRAPGTFVSLAAPFVRPGGRIVVMTTAESVGELDCAEGSGPPYRIVERQDLELPNGAPRCNVLIELESPNP